MLYRSGIILQGLRYFWFNKQDGVVYYYVLEIILTIIIWNSIIPIFSGMGMFYWDF